MIGSALNLYEAGAFDGTLMTDTDTDHKEEPFEREAPAFTTLQEGDLYVSRAEGLCGAKGALTAVGMEAATAFCLYGVWQVWHLLR